MKKFVPLHSQNRTTPVSLREISQRLAHSSIGLDERFSFSKEQFDSAMGYQDKG